MLLSMSTKRRKMSKIKNRSSHGFIDSLLNDSYLIYLIDNKGILEKKATHSVYIAVKCVMVHNVVGPAVAMA